MNPKTIKIDNDEYVRKSDIPHIQPNGNRCVLVVSSGWMFAGDVTEENGRIKLTRAVHIKRFRGCWFNGMISAPESDEVELAQLPEGVDVPKEAELFRVPVHNDWGLQ